MKKNYKTQSFYFNILVKAKDGAPDTARRISGAATIYDKGAIVVECEDDDLLIIACNDKREVFEPINKDGQIGVI